MGALKTTKFSDISDEILKVADTVNMIVDVPAATTATISITLEENPYSIRFVLVI